MAQRQQQAVTAGIVAEFNPFHNGHAALTAVARAQGASHVVAVMSGNFVQRGTAAATDKRVRTLAALRCGVDLVVELPLPWATGPAPRFARGAVGLLQAMGCVDRLCFGSECGAVEPLLQVSRAVEDPAVQPLLQRGLASGMTYARARQLAVEECCGPELGALLATPNNALAVEYLRQARVLNWDVQAFTLRRAGVGHDQRQPAGCYASASFLRAQAGDLECLRPYVPAGAWAVYHQAAQEGLFPAASQRLDTAVLAYLRRLSRDELGALPDLSEGLENRLYAAIRRASSAEELETLLKTKRYTLARVRRLILAAFLGLTREDCDASPAYLRVLGFNRRGRELMARMKTAALPVHTSLTRLEELGGACARQAQLEARATDLYTLALPRPRPCGYDYTASAVFLKKRPASG